MYNIEFYEDSNGRSELWEFLESLRVKAATNKDARIQYKQISLYIQLLEDNGTRLNENITKHLDDDIWELRPGNNRVLYFYFQLLHDILFKMPDIRRTVPYKCHNTVPSLQEAPHVCHALRSCHPADK